MTHEEAKRLLAFSAKYIKELEKIIFEQTQEPERCKHGYKDCCVCRIKETQIRGKNWDDPTPMPHAMDEKPAKKKMPCGHKLSDVSTGDEGTSYCRKCEEEAKKECEHKGFVIGCPDCEYEVMKHPKKDELAERLRDAYDGHYFDAVADEARKYFREMVKDIETSDWATAEYLKKEILSRLKESK